MKLEICKQKFGNYQYKKTNEKIKIVNYLDMNNCIIISSKVKELSNNIIEKDIISKCLIAMTCTDIDYSDFKKDDGIDFNSMFISLQLNSVIDMIEKRVKNIDMIYNMIDKDFKESITIEDLIKNILRKTDSLDIDKVTNILNGLDKDKVGNILEIFKSRVK